jgi:hypothetical protein
MKNKRNSKKWADQFDMKEVEQAAADWQMPEIREPDFSSVKKKIFHPLKVILFALIAAGFWVGLYWLAGAFRN